ncbi:MAG: FCD domain-containing protein [Burkholderiaceae bacterium]
MSDDRQITRIPQAVDTVEQHFETLVLTGQIRPGVNLVNERQLAKQAGVSRATLREALARLRIRGLLQTGQAGKCGQDHLQKLLFDAIKRLPAGSEADVFSLWAELARHCVEVLFNELNAEDENRLSHSMSLLAAVESEPNSDESVKRFEALWMLAAESTYNFLLVRTMGLLLEALRDTFVEVLSARRSRAHMMGHWQEEHPLTLLADIRSRVSVIGTECLKPLRLPKTSESTGGDSPSEAAYRQLRDKIGRGDFDQGEVLPSLPTLATELGLSEDATKLALQQAGVGGLVEFRPGGEVLVIKHKPRSPLKSLTEAIIRQPIAMEAVFEFRRMLEGWTMALACTGITAKHKTSISKIMKQLDDAAQNAPARFSKADFELHKAFAAASGNLAVAALQGALSRIIEQVIDHWLMQHRRHGGRNTEIQSQHHKIVTALFSGDAERACREMSAHIDYVIHALRQFERQQLVSQLASGRQAYVDIRQG